MRLRVRVNLILGTLMTVFVLASLVLALASTRSSVREEIAGANSAATRILRNLAEMQKAEGPAAMTERLRQIGHVRASDIELYDADGTLVYTSPPSRYRRGQNAPAWYATLVTPEIRTREIKLDSGKIMVRPSPSRVVLHGWDDFKRSLWLGLAALIGVNAAMFWIAGKALKPLHEVVAGLERLARGDYSVRLPEFNGQEGRLISSAFNHAASCVSETTAALTRADEATSRLQTNRELTREITQHIEEERRMIARELHDELGQSITAIKSIGIALAQRPHSGDPSYTTSVQMIIDTADRMYDAVHELIPRLRPMALDTLGLEAALSDLIGDWRNRRPGICFQLLLPDALPLLDEAVTTTAFRIVQESLLNAVRHASPQTITVSVGLEGSRLMLSISDDGKGLDPNWERSGHFGVLGMRERAMAIGGSCELLDNGESPGSTVAAGLPIGTGHHSA